MSARQPGLHDLLSATPVVPVLALDQVDRALPLARALIAGGLPVLEITLRTPAALDIIHALNGEIEGAVVGAGTVLSAGAIRGRGPGRRPIRGQPRRDAGTMGCCRGQFRAILARSWNL